jgi:hypothetical protein
MTEQVEHAPKRLKGSQNQHSWSVIVLAAGYGTRLGKDILESRNVEYEHLLFCMTTDVFFVSHI